MLAPCGLSVSRGDPGFPPPRSGQPRGPSSFLLSPVSVSHVPHPGRGAGNAAGPGWPACRSHPLRAGGGRAAVRDQAVVSGAEWGGREARTPRWSRCAGLSSAASPGCSVLAWACGGAGSVTSRVRTTPLALPVPPRKRTGAAASPGSTQPAAASERASGINDGPSSYYSAGVVMERLTFEQGKEGTKPNRNRGRNASLHLHLASGGALTATGARRGSCLISDVKPPGARSPSLSISAGRETSPLPAVVTCAFHLRRGRLARCAVATDGGRALLEGSPPGPLPGRLPSRARFLKTRAPAGTARFPGQ